MVAIEPAPPEPRRLPTDGGTSTAVYCPVCGHCLGIVGRLNALTQPVLVSQHVGRKWVSPLVPGLEVHCGGRRHRPCTGVWRCESEEAVP